jgi:hypothetical protein
VVNYSNLDIDQTRQLLDMYESIYCVAMDAAVDKDDIEYASSIYRSILLTRYALKNKLEKQEQA